jgi:hypothetical protein
VVPTRLADDLNDGAAGEDDRPPGAQGHMAAMGAKAEEFMARIKDWFS